MFIRGFQDLTVWKRSHELSLEIYKATAKFPRSEEFLIVNQLRRSSASIGANISEGCKKSTKDFIRYLMISRGSLEETRNFLMMAKDLKYLTKDDADLMLHKSDEIGKMLYSLIKSLKNKTTNNQKQPIKNNTLSTDH